MPSTQMHTLNQYQEYQPLLLAVLIWFQCINQRQTAFLHGNKWIKLSNALEGDYNIRRHVRSKILGVYFPNDFLSMHGNKQAGEIQESVFGLSPSQIDEGLFMKQSKLLHLKNSHSITDSIRSWADCRY